MPKIKILKKDTYLALIKNSVNSCAFKDVYGEINNKKKNLTKNGDLSCAYFVSSVLKIFDLIGSLHLTVSGVIKDIEKYGWKKIAKSKIKLW